MPSHDLLGSHPCLVTNDWESPLPIGRSDCMGSHYCGESYVTMTPGQGANTVLHLRLHAVLNHSCLPVYELQ